MDKAALDKGLSCTTKAQINAWAQAMDIGLGIPADKALEILKAAKDKAAKAAKDSKLADSLAKVKVPSNLAKLAKANPDTTIFVTIDEGKVSFGIKAKAKAKQGSCMSARTAWDYAVKAKCSIVLAADFERDVVAVAKATPGISQRGILFRDFNASEAVAKLRDYGYTS